MKYYVMVIIVAISQLIFCWLISIAEAMDPRVATPGFSIGTSNISVTVYNVITTTLRTNGTNGTYCIGSNEPEMRYDIIVITKTNLSADLIRDGNCSAVKTNSLLKGQTDASAVIIVPSVR